ncbi:hypothetical protein NIES4074_25890 [Cylindrospermum sp. NIES-4074]|nr:hypothetical protein NIES4074_25890 [Cylindrospermum sp. NIES-4074]
MPKITLEVSEELYQQLAQIGNERLPELLALSLQQPAVPAQVYRYILDFIASNPTLEQIADFKPTPEMQARLRTLLARSKAGELTPTELQELDEYERIEHLIMMIKAGNLSKLKGVPGKQLLGFVGSIPKEDLQLISEAIEQDCNQVNTTEENKYPLRGFPIEYIEPTEPTAQSDLETAQ